MSDLIKLLLGHFPENEAECIGKVLTAYLGHEPQFDDVASLVFHFNRNTPNEYRIDLRAKTIGKIERKQELNPEGNWLPDKKKYMFTFTPADPNIFCGNCQRNRSTQLHTCPYRYEIEDDKTLCDCCESCCELCADEV